MCSKIKTVTAFVSIWARLLNHRKSKALILFSGGQIQFQGKCQKSSLHSENGGGCLGVVLKEAFPSPCFLPASPAGPMPPPRAAKSSLNTSLRPNPVKANNKLRIYVQKGHLALGAGDRRAIQPRREHPTAAQEGRAAHLPSRPPLRRPSQTTAWPKHHSRSRRSRNVPKYLKKATPA